VQEPGPQLQRAVEGEQHAIASKEGKRCNGGVAHKTGQVHAFLWPRPKPNSLH